jgi:hypothetical protein
MASDDLQQQSFGLHTPVDRRLDAPTPDEQAQEHAR